jgi:site-specific DNA-methyltransferase (adenine-specific)
MEFMRSLPDDSIDLILCDPPYGIMVGQDWDVPLPLDDLWPIYNRIAKGPIVLFSQAPFDKTLATSNLKRFKHEWIWEKSRANGFLTANKAPLRAHETILVFSSGGSLNYTPQKTEGHKRIKANRKQKNKDLYLSYGANSYDSTSRFPRSVLRFKSIRSPYHPTEKPQDILTYLIKTYCPEGGTVLDNCMGAGSTGIAALNAGRRFIGIEKDATFFGHAKRRIEEITPVSEAA